MGRNEVEAAVAKMREAGVDISTYLRSRGFQAQALSCLDGALLIASTAETAMMLEDGAAKAKTGIGGHE